VGGPFGGATVALLFGGGLVGAPANLGDLPVDAAAEFGDLLGGAAAGLGDLLVGGRADGDGLPARLGGGGLGGLGLPGL
jgi:hypothetical protein